MRRIAAEIGLPNAAKKDSTGICFIGERPFREFLNRYLANTPGPMKDDRGRHASASTSACRSTRSGQRKGIGIGGLKERGAARGASEHAPWFVARKDIDRNTLYVVQGHDHPWLLGRRAARPTMPAGSPATRRRRARYAAKTRYRQADAACRAARRRRGRRVRRCASTTPQWAVTPGQSAVLYDGEVCLGGGVIASASMTEPAPVAA